YSNSESGGENGQWTVDGTPSDTPQTGGGVYGFDASYLGSTGDSNGSAMKVTVDRALMQAVSSGSTVWPSANFSFTGTGLDLISHIGEDSGVLTIDLVPEGSSWSYVGNNARHVTIDTYYTGGTLHQVPVFRIENLPYGSYSIRVIARYSPRFDHQSNEYVGIKGGSEINEPGLEPGVEYTVMSACANASEALPGRAYGSFTSFIDGIRVYNPLGTELPEAAAEAYAADGELAPEFCNVNGLLEGDDAIYVTIGDDSVEPADYVDVSPKNEVYIRPGGAIAFGIDGDYSAVHIGAKSPLGKSVSMKISGGEPIELTHTTELYYDITSLIEGNRVSIEVSGSDPDAILSLVCIKLIPSDAGGVSPRIVSDASLAEFVEAIHFGIVGDADRDGAVSITDALLVMRTLLEGSELGTYASFCADINRDGSIDMADALSILRLAMAII
ncbi:MAG: dockerin type I repeat-containing protein, partial [Clostridia bacterium]|nr:dockerin type I repeat-containing protein [Clostridia bacterium]